MICFQIQFLLENIEDHLQKRKILERAAQLTPLVTSVTLGPNSTFQSNDKQEETLNISSENKENGTAPRILKFKKSPATSSDFKGLQNRMQSQVIEKQIKEIVRKQMEDRIARENVHYQKIQNNLEAMRLEAERKHREKIDSLLRQIETALKIEEQDEAAYQKDRTELTINTRKIREHLQRLDKLEENFNKICRSCRAEMSAIVELCKKQFEGLKAMKNTVRSIDGLENICSMAEDICGALKTHKDRADKEAEERLAAAAREAEERLTAAARAQEQAAKLIALAPPPPPPQPPMEEKVVPPLPSPPPVAMIAPQARPQIQPQLQQLSETGRQFNELLQLLHAKQMSTKQLNEAPELQTTRFALKLAVNNPINMLNEDSKSTLLEGFQKLHNLLAGQTVQTAKGAVSIANDAKASDWTKLRVAEKLIVGPLFNSFASTLNQ